MRRAAVLGLCVWLAGCGTTVTFPDQEGGGDGEGGSGSGPGSGGDGAAAPAGSGGAQTTTGAGGAQTTTGAGGAPTGTTAGAGGSSSGGGFPTTTTGAGGGSPFCKTCGDALFGSTDPFCAGSQGLFDALVQCACVTGCPSECANECSAQGDSPLCTDCLFTSCSMQVDACFADEGP